MLNVTLHNIDGEVIFEASDRQATDADDAPDYGPVKYVSHVAPSTYGPPAVIAPSKDRTTPLARPGDSVLYINTRLVPFWMIEKLPD